MRNLLISVLLIATGCGNRLPRPAEIDASDMCAQCKMAISERRYAAEISDGEGNVIKFDNIDCMVRYAAVHGLKDKAAAWFVMNSDGREWLDAHQAFLVKSPSIPGPMGSGILAVGNPGAADDLAHRFSADVLRFEDLWRQ